MIEKIQNFKYSLLTAILIYVIGALLSASIILILNIDLGKPSFDKDLGTWFDIFLHNIQVQLFLILGGVTLGVLTSFLLFVNGFYSGFVLGQSLIGDYHLEVVKQVALHGIFENIAFFISGSVGIQFATIAIINRFSKTTLQYFDRYFLNKLIVIIIFTLIASFFEATIYK
jgi:stage II sporulation protein M